MSNILKVKEFLDYQTGDQFVVVKSVDVTDEGKKGKFITSAKRIKDGRIFVSQEPFHIRKKILGGLKLIQEVSVDVFYGDMISVDISAYYHTEDYSYCAGVEDIDIQINNIEDAIGALLDDLDKQFMSVYPNIKY